MYNYYRKNKYYFLYFCKMLNNLEIINNCFMRHLVAKNIFLFFITIKHLYTLEKFMFDKP